MLSPRFRNKEKWRQLHCVIHEQLELLLPSLNHPSAAVPAVGAPSSFAGNRLYNAKTTNAQAAALPMEKRISPVGNRLEAAATAHCTFERSPAQQARLSMRLQSAQSKANSPPPHPALLKRWHECTRCRKRRRVRTAPRMAACLSCTYLSYLEGCIWGLFPPLFDIQMLLPRENKLPPLACWIYFEATSSRK